MLGPQIEQKRAVVVERKAGRVAAQMAVRSADLAIMVRAGAERQCMRAVNRANAKHQKAEARVRQLEEEAALRAAVRMSTVVDDRDWLTIGRWAAASLPR